MHQQFRIVGPIGVGTLKPASLINSKENSIRKISNVWYRESYVYANLLQETR